MQLKNNELLKFRVQLHKVWSHYSRNVLIMNVYLNSVYLKKKKTTYRAAVFLPVQTNYSPFLRHCVAVCLPQQRGTRRLSVFLTANNSLRDYNHLLSGLDWQHQTEKQIPNTLYLCLPYIHFRHLSIWYDKSTSEKVVLNYSYHLLCAIDLVQLTAYWASTCREQYGLCVMPSSASSRCSTRPPCIHCGQ